MTNIEVSIDYPEYDTPEVTNNEILETIKSSKENLEELKK